MTLKRILYIPQLLLPMLTHSCTQNFIYKNYMRKVLLYRANSPHRVRKSTGYQVWLTGTWAMVDDYWHSLSGSWGMSRHGCYLDFSTWPLKQVVSQQTHPNSVFWDYFLFARMTSSMQNIRVWFRVQCGRIGYTLYIYVFQGIWIVHCFGYGLVY